MPEKKLKRIVRPATAEERQRHAEIRQRIMQEFPPASDSGRQESPPGIPYGDLSIEVPVPQSET